MKGCFRTPDQATGGSPHEFANPQAALANRPYRGSAQRG
jgi:hypothetical protein